MSVRALRYLLLHAGPSIGSSRKGVTGTLNCWLQKLQTPIPCVRADIVMGNIYTPH
jgi:hypothetical protein